MAIPDLYIFQVSKANVEHVDVGVFIEDQEVGNCVVFAGQIWSTAKPEDFIQKPCSLFNPFKGKGLSLGREVADLLREQVALPHHDGLEQSGPEFVLVPREKLVDNCTVLDGRPGEGLGNLRVLFAKVE